MKEKTLIVDAANFDKLKQTTLERIAEFKKSIDEYQRLANENKKSLTLLLAYEEKVSAYKYMLSSLERTYIDIQKCVIRG